MSSNERPDPEVMRSYTKALRIRTYIGRFTDGTTLPGGPYTLPQGVAFAITLLGAYWTRPLWTRWGLLDYVAILAVSFAAAKIMARVPETARNPLAVALVGASAALAPRNGVYAGRSLRPRAVTVVTGRVLIAWPPGPPPAADHLPSAPAGTGPTAPSTPVPRPAATFPAGVGAAPVSAIARLLASHPVGRTR